MDENHVFWSKTSFLIIFVRLQFTSSTKLNKLQILDVNKLKNVHTCLRLERSALLVITERESSATFGFRNNQTQVICPYPVLDRPQLISARSFCIQVPKLERKERKFSIGLIISKSIFRITLCSLFIG